jgi:hypothetical protein
MASFTITAEFEAFIEAEDEDAAIAILYKKFDEWDSGDVRSPNLSETKAWENYHEEYHLG